LTSDNRNAPPVLPETSHRPAGSRADGTRFTDQSEHLNPRQLKVLNRLIDDELRNGFDGGMNNTKYQKITGIGDRTALRDLAQLQEPGLMIKTGQLKGTRYHLNAPHIIAEL
jgi:Fic family protein